MKAVAVIDVKANTLADVEAMTLNGSLAERKAGELVDVLFGGLAEVEVETLTYTLFIVKRGTNSCCALHATRSRARNAKRQASRGKVQGTTR